MDIAKGLKELRDYFAQMHLAAERARSMPNSEKARLDAESGAYEHARDMVDAYISEATVPVRGPDRWYGAEQ